MNSHKFRKQLDVFLDSHSNEEIKKILKECGIDFVDKPCDLCYDTRRIQPDGCNNKMICWKC